MKKWTSTYCLIFTYLCVIFSGNLGAVELGTWQKHMDQGSWRAAAVEAERIYFFTADPVLRARALIARAQAQQSMNRYDDAMKSLQRISPRNLPEEVRYEMLHERALTHFKNSEWSSVRTTLQRLNHDISDPRLQLLSGYLGILALIQLEKWEEVIEEAHLYIRNLQEAYSRDMVRTESVELSRHTPYELESPEWKSGQKAGMLSTFLPGSGQWYAGHRMEGSGSALLHAAFLAWAGYNILSGYYLTALFTGGGPLQAFHSGGVQRAEKMAVDHNRSLAENLKFEMSQWFLDTIEEPLKKMASPEGLP